MEYVPKSTVFLLCTFSPGGLVGVGAAPVAADECWCGLVERRAQLAQKSSPAAWVGTEGCALQVMGWSIGAPPGVTW